jgi:hypothetical protein
MSFLIDITELIMSKNLDRKRPRTKTTLFRAAFTLLAGGKSIRYVGKTLSINRKKLKAYYEAFLLSKKDLEDYVFCPLKQGRKSTLSTQDISIMKICAHTLDSVGYPTSKISMNALILRLQEGSHSKRKKLSRASLMRYRRLTQLPRKTVRNGTSARSSKSKEEFIVDYHQKYVDVVTRFQIRKEFMFVFISFFITLIN